MSHDDLSVSTFYIGSNESVVRSFSVFGLYGYRSLSISSEHAASIVIARNGSGKTTLLGAMDAFLRGHFTRLKDIPFERIECQLRGVDQPLVLLFQDLVDFLDTTSNNEFAKLFRQHKFERWTLLRFLVEEYPKFRETYPGHLEDEIYSTICAGYDYNIQTTTKHLDSVREALFDKNNNIRYLLSVINEVLGNIDIVYLPTFRRIEFPLLSDGDDRRSRRQSKPNIKLGGTSLYTGNIEFGLTDISDKLESMNGSISFESSYKYREVSASIITELIDDDSKVNDVEIDDLPTKPELDLFFSRIKNDRYTGPYNHKEIPNIDKIFIDGKVSNIGGFLKYYLSKLDPIIKSTRDIEASVDQFIELCNSYLMADDSSVGMRDEHGEMIPNYDAKELILDKRTYRLTVESVHLRRKMSIDYLSSGEKQMISLFARLYLYPGKKIILIDEPELSLSLDWQRKILVDVLRAPTCAQFIAITHSPFVFDNVLDSFARPLKVAYSKGA